MSTSRFSIKFDGPAIINGEIDVLDFAPAVLSLGELIRASNHILNNDRAKAKIKATHEGSFEALLTLDILSFEAASGFFKYQDSFIC